MSEYPFHQLQTITLAGNGTGTILTTVSQNESFEIEEIMVVSTGAFSITGIRDTSNIQYSNAASGLTIPSTLMVDAATDFSNTLKFNPGLLIEKGRQLAIDLVDTSGSSNTVKFIMRGKKAS